MYRLTPGVRLQPLHDTWAAWSPLSGETLQLNPEAASVLELLAEGQHDPAQIAATLAEDTALPLPQIIESLQPVWQQLCEAGLIENTAAVAASG